VAVLTRVFGDIDTADAIRADLLRRLGRPGEAALAYRAALALTGNPAERAYLAARLAEASRRE
jgi:RNA polymerase sigma-70 factor, ECF subfamily